MTEELFSKVEKGDIVTMMGDMSEGIFELQVNGITLRKLYIMEFYEGASDDYFVPFVSLRDGGSVSLVCNFADIGGLPLFLCE